MTASQSHRRLCRGCCLCRPGQAADEIPEAARSPDGAIEQPEEEGSRQAVPVGVPTVEVDAGRANGPSLPNWSSDQAAEGSAGGITGPRPSTT